MYAHFRYGKLPFNPDLVQLNKPIPPEEDLFWVDQTANRFVDQDGNNLIFSEPA